MIYSKESLRKASSNPKAQNILASGSSLKEREWNRHVAGYVIDDFLSSMKQEDSLEFIQYGYVLSFIQAGMFDTTSRHLIESVIPNLQSDSLKVKATLLAQNLADSDEVPK